MKRFLVLAIILFTSIPSGFSLAAEYNLIEYMEMSLKSTENPKRLEASFDLTEALDLSQGSSDIVFEYLATGNDGILSAVYRKDKSWSGYLNSYDYYPTGERKYSSGTESAAYPDSIPAARIYTSVKSGSSIDVTKIDAVRVTVLRANGSGERVTIYSDGTVSATEKIEASVIDIDKNTGIRLEATTSELPADTVLVAGEVTGGPVYDMVSAALAGTKDLVVFDIRLESISSEISLVGTVKLSFIIPEAFEGLNLAVYRIDADGALTYYPVTIEAIDDVEYASFETDHFSIYALAEVINAELESEIDEYVPPKTGVAQTGGYDIAVVIISAVPLALWLGMRKKHLKNWK